MMIRAPARTTMIIWAGISLLLASATGLCEGQPIKKSEGSTASATDKNRFRVFESDEYLKGYAYVQFEPRTSVAATNTATTDAGAQKVVWRSRLIPGLCRVKLAAGDEQKVVNAYLDNPQVLYAQPQYLYRPTVNPNDPRYGDLWGMVNSRAPLAWDTYTGDANRMIAVIDSGIDLDHGDLAANIWTSPVEQTGDANGDGFPGIAGIDDDSDGLFDEDSNLLEPGQTGYTNDLVNDDDENGYVDDIHGYDFGEGDSDPSDSIALCNSHGTHVSGTIGAVGNNATGVVGVNWRCKLVACKTSVVLSGQCRVINTVEALEYALLAGCRISNNSYNSNAFDQTMFNMIQTAQQHGHIFIASAGNNNTDNDTTARFPASYNLPNIISVAAINSNDQRWTDSNWGAASVDLGAPGDGVLSTIDGGYDTMSGTSMACPHVAGAAALILGRFPHTPWQQVRNRILASTRPITALENITVTGGVLDITRALAVWVDFYYSGDQDGNFHTPFTTLDAGFDGTPHNGSLIIKSGSTSWTGAINQVLTLHSHGGSTFIGASGEASAATAE